MADGTQGGTQPSWGDSGRPAPEPPPASAWWARDALADPWRNPQMTAVVARPAQPQLPPVEPPISQQPVRMGVGVVVVIAVVTAIVAGMVGGLIGGNVNQEVTARFDDPRSEPLSGSFQEKIAQILPSVVTIWVTAKDGGGGNGSGFIYSSEGYIVTNQHVASLADAEGSKIMIEFSDHRQASAEVVGMANTTDVAVLKTDASNIKALSIADSNDVHVGDPVIAVGAPLGLSHTVTEGIVSAIDRPVVSGESKSDATVAAAIQTDAAINPGNSGGPLLNTAGQVIGINTSIYTFGNEDGEGGSIGLGFAISSQQFERIVKEIIDTGKATRTVLGAEIKAPSGNTLGATVSRVESDSPAAEAGLATSDVITEFDGQRITDDVHLRALILKHAPGDTISITYEHDGSEKNATVKLASASDD